MKEMCEITLRESTERDADFVNALTRRVMQKYVDATWKTSEDRERYYLHNGFDQPATRIIQCNGEDAGRMTVTYSVDRIILEGIHIAEGFQGRGAGGRLLEQLIDEAKRMRLPLELMLLKVNPAKNLYERAGFHVYREDVNRFYMRLAV